MAKQIKRIGVVGMGLMGKGIAACALGYGYQVVGCDKSPGAAEAAKTDIDRAIGEMVERLNFPASLENEWPARYEAVESIAAAKDCDFIIETVPEVMELKQAVYDELEAVLPEDVIIASNTSSLPITQLQQPRNHPQRFVGMHWGPPCHIWRFVEIVKGEQTSDETMQVTEQLAEDLGKEPSLLQKDVRAFIANRFVYAILREAIHLLESGVGDVETIDRAFRNDIGWWTLLMGPFRWMDLTGIPAYAKVMRGLFPDLADTKELPRTMREMEESGANGVFNGKGFYDYTPEQAEKWQRAWEAFTWDIRALADKYTPTDSDHPGGVDEPKS